LAREGLEKTPVEVEWMYPKTQQLSGLRRSGNTKHGQVQGPEGPCFLRLIESSYKKR